MPLFKLHLSIQIAGDATKHRIAIRLAITHIRYFTIYMLCAHGQLVDVVKIQLYTHIHTTAYIHT